MNVKAQWGNCPETLDMKRRSTQPRNEPVAVEVDYQQLSIELVRALRGKRSQTAMSRRAGYRSSAVHRWESGRSWPTAASFLHACQSLGLDVARAYSTFFQRRPQWLDTLDPCSAEAVASFLRQLRGKTPIAQLAKQTRFNRFSLARWFLGTAEPKLPQLLCLIWGWRVWSHPI